MWWYFRLRLNWTDLGCTAEPVAVIWVTASVHSSGERSQIREIYKRNLIPLVRWIFPCGDWTLEQCNRAIKNQLFCHFEFFFWKKSLLSHWNFLKLFLCNRKLSFPIHRQGKTNVTISAQVKIICHNLCAINFYLISFFCVFETVFHCLFVNKVPTCVRVTKNFSIKVIFLARRHCTWTVWLRFFDFPINDWKVNERPYRSIARFPMSQQRRKRSPMSKGHFLQLRLASDSRERRLRAETLAWGRLLQPPCYARESPETAGSYPQAMGPLLRLQIVGEKEKQAQSWSGR